MVPSAKKEHGDGVGRTAESVRPSINIEVLSLERASEAFTIHLGISEFAQSGAPPRTWEDFQERCSGKVDTQLLLTSLNGEPAGYALGYKMENQPGYYVDLAGVRDDFRRQGVHTAMMNYLENYALQKGYDSVWFKTWRKREAMRDWARTHGYRHFKIESRENSAEDRLFYQKILE